jgi:CheY-like chemotaxis protein
MGGSIAMESERGVGSCFWFELDMPIADSPALPEPIASSRPEPVRPLRILAAEDNAANQEVLRAMLELLGCEITIVDNGRAAVDALEQSRDYDIVFMDCQMPVLDGYHAASEIRRNEEQGSREAIPIVAVTAHAYSGERAKVLAAGMDDYLTKPLSLGALRETLTRWSPSASILPGTVPNGPAVPVLEQATIDELRSYASPRKPNFFADVVAKYVRSAEGITQDIRIALEANDLERVKKLAHTLKGSSRTMGAAEVGQLAEELERLAETADARLATSLEELEVALGRAIRALNQASAA